ncbi:MAG: acyl-CoA dehydrogenase, partial [Pseudomonadota bacterium]
MTALVSSSPQSSLPSDRHTSVEPGRFVWDDAFLLECQLTEDERLISETARGFARDTLLPRIESAYLNE